MKRLIAALAGICIVCIGAWLGGFEFNQRGESAVGVYIVALVLGFLGFTYPFKD